MRRAFRILACPAFSAYVTHRLGAMLMVVAAARCALVSRLLLLNRVEKKSQQISLLKFYETLFYVNLLSRLVCYLLPGFVPASLGQHRAHLNRGPTAAIKRT